MTDVPKATHIAADGTLWRIPPADQSDGTGQYFDKGTWVCSEIGDRLMHELEPYQPHPSTSLIAVCAHLKIPWVWGRHMGSEVHSVTFCVEDDKWHNMMEDEKQDFVTLKAVEAELVGWEVINDN